MPITKYSYSTDIASIKHFRAYLNIHPNDKHIALVFNLTHMLLGTYPASVPENHLISFDLKNKTDLIFQFRDVSESMGFNSKNLGKGLGAGGSIEM